MHQFYQTPTVAPVWIDALDNSDKRSRAVVYSWQTVFRRKPAMQRLIWAHWPIEDHKGLLELFPREAKDSAETPDNGFAGWWAATVLL